MIPLLTLLAATAAPAAPATPAMTPPALRPPLDPAATPYRAEGTRPGWALDVTGGTLVFRRDGLRRDRALTLPAPPPRISFDGFHWQADGAFGGLTADIRHARCRGFRGAVFPDQVTVKLGGATYRGCGGPALPDARSDALEGSYWRLRAIDRQRLRKDADVSLRFARGRVLGRDGCNAFGATYTITPDRLRFANAIASEVGCRPGIRPVERATFALLGQDMGWRLRHGQLILTSADGHTAWFRTQNPHAFERTVKWRHRPAE